MRPYCPAIRHLRNCHGNISSLRRSLAFKARWSNRLERRLHRLWFEPHEQLWFLLFFSLSPFFFSFPLPFQFFFQWMSTKFESYIKSILHSFWVGHTV